MRVFPGRLERVGVVLDVLDVLAALEHQHPQPALGELLGRPAARDAGADDDGVEGFGLKLHDVPQAGLKTRLYIGRMVMFRNHTGSP